MQTTVNRKGEVKQLVLKEGKQSCTVAFAGGYMVFYFTEQDIPSGLMLKDRVEVALTIETED